MAKIKLGVGTVFAGRDNKGKVLDYHLEIVRFYWDEMLNREMIETAKYYTKPTNYETKEVRADFSVKEIGSMLRRNLSVIILYRDYTKRNV